MPGADTPSSLVTRITGFSFFLVAGLFAVAFAGFLVFDIGSNSERQKCFVFSGLPKGIL